MEIRLWLIWFPASLAWFPKNHNSPNWQLSRTAELQSRYESGQLATHPVGLSLPSQPNRATPALNYQITSHQPVDLELRLGPTPTIQTDAMTDIISSQSSCPQDALQVDTGVKRNTVMETERDPSTSPIRVTSAPKLSGKQPVQHAETSTRPDIELQKEIQINQAVTRQLPVNLQPNNHQTWANNYETNPMIENSASNHLRHRNRGPASDTTEFRSIYPNQEGSSSLVETNSSRRFRNLEDSLHRTRGKKIKKSSEIIHPPPTIHSNKSPARPGNLLVLPYVKVVDFGPVSIDGELMVQAINSLKTPDGTKFMDLFVENSNNQMICVEKSYQSVDQFISLYVKSPNIILPEKSMLEYDENIASLKNRIKKQDDKILRFGNLVTCWENFSLENKLLQLDEEIKLKVEEYKSFVMKEIRTGGHLTDIEEELKSILINRNINKQQRPSDYFRVLNLLPAYLFHVDMISTIIPIDNLENGALLSSQRQIAVTRFFEIIEVMLSRGTKNPFQYSKDQVEHELIQKVVDSFKAPFWISRAGTIIWRFVNYWIWTSRRDLINHDTNSHEPSNHFKSFFNSLFMSFQEPA